MFSPEEDQPSRWYQDGPYSISTGAAFGPTSGRRRVTIHRTRVWSLRDEEGTPPVVYQVEVHGREQQYLDPNGGLHRAAVGYKLHQVPEHATFEGALAVADAYADGASAPLVHQDRVMFEVVDQGPDAHARYGVRSRWNDEPSSGGELFDSWREAHARAERRVAAARAAATRRAKARG